jgi:cytochrome P450
VSPVVARLDVDLFTSSFISDPYPVYEEIRAVSNGPVWNELLRAWVIVGFDEGVGVMTDNERFLMMNTGEMTPWFEAPNMITVDGEMHRRLRGALAPLFTRSAVAQFEQRIKDVVGTILEPLVSGNDSFDLIADFTKLPTIIVADMLGVPTDRHADFMRWSHTIVTNLAYGLEDEDRRTALEQASQELNDYMAAEIDRRRRQPTDDLLSTMLGFSGRDAMSIEEIRSTGILLLVAGYDTTAKAMANCLIAFEKNPEQRRMIADDLELLPSAIEEALRWYGPVQGGGRIAAVDTDVAGTPIAAGDRVFVFRAAANRDPRRWERAHEFDLFRSPKSHLGFGWGPHLCLGAPLARLEVRVALEQLLRLTSDYRIRDVHLGRSAFIRGPEAGTIEVGARGA